MYVGVVGMSHLVVYTCELHVFLPVPLLCSVVHSHGNP